MYDLIFKNGNIYLNGHFVLADMAIKDEKIVSIGENLSGKFEIDVSGKWVLPGAIDVHTHFSLPFANALSSDDFYTGSIAGAAGGVTTFIDFTAQSGTEGVLDSLLRRKQEALELAALDYSFHACIGRFSDAVKAQIPGLVSVGVTSLKIFTAYKNMMQTDDNLFEIMKLCKKHNILLTVHAENGVLIDSLTDKVVKENKDGIEGLAIIRPIFTETEAIRRIADFARYTGCKTYIVHVSSGQGASILERERKLNAPVNGETCPHYLYLDNSKFNCENGHYYACCPPIREKIEQEAIWKALNSKSLAVVATDHCPFTTGDKDTWQNTITKLPMGLPGIETLPELVLNGVHQKNINLENAIKSISENPAKIFGMYPQKGSLDIGSDADVMVYDPTIIHKISQSKLHMNNDYSVYEGMEIQGKNIMTMLRGKIIYDLKNGWQGKKGAGRFIKRGITDESFF